MTLSAPPINVQHAVQALWDVQAVANPYPNYERVRALSVSGILPLPDWNSVIITGHEAANAVLRSGAAQSGKVMQAQDSTHSEGLKLLQSMMLFHNGLSHQRLRGLVQLAFTPRVVQEQRELVRTLIAELLAQMQKNKQTDLVAGLSNPLPARVIMSMLGLKPDEEAQFVRWSESVAELLSGDNQSPELMARLEKDAREMRAYFRELAEQLRAHPQPGLLSALAAAEDGGQRLSGDELLSNAVLLLVAGHETTSNLIPGGLLELHTQPQAWAELVQNPLHPNIPDELIRVVSPVQHDGRTLSEDLNILGQTLSADSFVQIMLAAANRDPAVFEHPDRLDWNRPNSNKHLGFAAGPHYCLGASLARLEIAETYAALAQQFPNLRVLDPNPPFKPNTLLRGVSRLDVQLSP